jgi:hypothetical protein
LVQPLPCGRRSVQNDQWSACQSDSATGPVGSLYMSGVPRSG